MEDEWDRDRVVRAHQEIASTNIELVPQTSDALDAAAGLRSQHDALNVFDGVHLGSAAVLDESIVSTDTLFPKFRKSSISIRAISSDILRAVNGGILSLYQDSDRAYDELTGVNRIRLDPDENKDST